jgi:hypothetical protein
VSVSGNDDVGGLQVAMDEAFVVCRRQTARDLSGVLDHAPQGQAAGHELRSQRLAVHELHHDVRDFARLGGRSPFGAGAALARRSGFGALAADIVDRDKIGVRKRRECLTFAFESRPRGRIVGEMMRQHLERDRTVQPRVPGAVHLAHAAFTERTHDLIRA